VISDLVSDGREPNAEIDGETAGDGVGQVRGLARQTSDVDKIIL